MKQGQIIRVLSYNIQVAIGTSRAHHYLTRSWRHVLPHTGLYENMDRIATILSDYDIVALQEADEIIVVDNASTDGSVEMVINEFPTVRLIQAQENRGLSVASNIALHESTGTYLLYLGTDAFPEAGVITGLAA